MKRRLDQNKAGLLQAHFQIDSKDIMLFATLAALRDSTFFNIRYMLLRILSYIFIPIMHIYRFKLMVDGVLTLPSLQLESNRRGLVNEEIIRLLSEPPGNLQYEDIVYTG